MINLNKGLIYIINYLKKEGNIIMTKTGEYSIKVNKATKVIEISIIGSFTPEQAKAFHTDYQAKVSSIVAEDFILKVDCTDMNIITQEMLPKLEISFNMYKESGFKEVQFIIKQSATIKMQLNRVARNTGLTNAVVVEL